MEKLVKLMKNKIDKKVYIVVLIATIISITSSYVLAATLVNSKDVYYEDNSGLAVNNVQAAIDGTCTKFSNELTNFLNKIYPVGSIYISTASTNPSSFLGGTWEAYGKGQTLVGIDTNQTEFNTVGKTGGAKSVSYTPSGSIGSTGLTISQIPSHSHSYDKVDSTTGSHTLTIAEMPSHTHGIAFPDTGYPLEQSTTTPGSTYHRFLSGVTVNTYNSYGAFYANATGGGGGHTHPISTTSTSTGVAGKGTTSDGHTHSFTGTATTINNLQPYITVYMWHRTK